MDIQIVQKTYEKPIMELISAAHSTHLENFKLGEIQTSQLLSIKTGGCPENCAYCPQSAHYQTGVKKEPLMSVEEVVEKAKSAKSNGATRFCMGAAWREVRDGAEFDQVLEMVKAVNNEGLQSCCTLGMLNEEQAQRLKDAGLYAYNHNIDTSEKHYEKVISTRTYEDRLRTIENVRSAGLTVCTGGILGMGEDDSDRVLFLHRLASFSPQPESVTINTLVKIPGTPLAAEDSIDALTVIRVIACARILIPKSTIRLSAGRLSLSKTEQLMAYYVGANSIFLGEKLLTSPNPEVSTDQSLFDELSLKPMDVNASV